MTTNKISPAKDSKAAVTQTTTPPSVKPEGGISFQKKEMSMTASLLAPYLSAKAAVGIRLAGGRLEFFAAAGVSDFGSALVRVPCKAKSFDWKHVDAPTFSGVISAADDGAISMEFGENALTVRCAPHSVNELRYFDSQQTPIRMEQPAATLSGEDFNVIAMMTESASDDMARPALQGVYLAAQNGEIESAAADGFILSFKESKAANLTDTPGAVYSAKALFNAKRAAKAGSEEVGISFVLKGKDVIPGLILSVRREYGIEALYHVPQMGGQFPDYKQITKAAPDPDESVVAELPTSSVAMMLKRARALGGNLFLQVINGRFWYMARNDAKEQAIDSIPLDPKIKDSVLMAYDPRRFGDILKACAANGRVKLVFPDEARKPMLITGMANGLAMPLAHDLKESPFKNLQPALL